MSSIDQLASKFIRSFPTSLWYFLWRKWKYKFAPEKALLVLLYHRVSDDGVSAVKVGVFHEQMEFLRVRGFSTTSFQEAIRKKQKKLEFDSKEIVITFDDGYLDNYINAFPVLKEYGFSATIFLTVHDIFEKPSDDKLTPSQIREMQSYGIDFGAHTLSHPYLTRLDQGKMREEIFLSKEVLENTLAQEVSFFSYPYGAFNNAVKLLVREAGYLGACTNRGGRNKGDFDLLEMKRIQVSTTNQTIFDFKKKIEGALDIFYLLTRR